MRYRGSAVKARRVYLLANCQAIIVKLVEVSYLKGAPKPLTHK